METGSALSKVESHSEDDLTNLLGADIITKDWILMNSPVPIVVIIGIYLVIILKIGPAYMDKREPYDMKTVMRLYNIFQVIYNSGLILIPFYYYYEHIPYCVAISCRIPTEYDENINELKNMYLILFWNFLILKIVDLLDTVFMVMRKKNSHITFLHVYHHVAMVVFTWFTGKYIKSHQAVFPGFINILVHAIMYSYYFLATFGPSVRKYLWWKRHLTKLQLAQFAVVMLYIFLLYYNGCPISRVFTYIWLFNVFIFLCLFANFYVKAYILKSSKQTKSL
ncbi:elongation of very long chain fatty acids protein 4-like [Homalodisca vitripennis]|uniref:elongation of very long chain fatty acids protein 4-like n=1 Tax=Homalodisca vitripennis TaxID=197043 RepID=UPI001EEA4734|nr:elongation of very long chain fatty acids protein 4-like [Homalodisca vitripennis]